MSIQLRLDRKSCESRAVSVLNEAGVTKHPVRVDRIAKSHQIKIRYEPLEDELSGMIFFKGDIPVIGVNARHNANRQRFTIAHELGHFFLHSDVLRRGAHVDKVVTILNRDSEAARGVSNIEIEANQFAAELLMPKFLIAAFLGKNGLDIRMMPDDDIIAEMAKAFRVSMTAIAIRLGTIF